MRQIAAVSFFAVLLPAAANLPGFGFWPASELKSYGKKLAPKINAQKVAVEQAGTYGNHRLVIVHREGSGEAELHEKDVDVFVVQDGRGTLVVGGKMMGAKTTAPGEIRGTSIQGGDKRELAPGDIAHIPANIPHQVLLAPGKQITYVIVKVRQ